MSNQVHFIAQIQQKEKEAENILKKLEEDNNKKITKANENSLRMIEDAEDAARKVAVERVRKAKEKAKEEYKKILVYADNERRDIIENGKAKLPKAQKHVKNVFMGLFE